jgi:hypothetical protein
MPSRYEIRLSRRNKERERALCGESLDAYRRRATAPPPTLGEIYARNKVNRERCPWSWDIEDLLAEDGI